MRLETYGPKLTENVVQAVARDLLAHGMTQISAAGYQIVLHVHDEIVAEVPAGGGSIEEFERLMSTMPSWAAGGLTAAMAKLSRIARHEKIPESSKMAFYARRKAPLLWN